MHHKFLSNFLTFFYAEKDADEIIDNFEATYGQTAPFSSDIAFVGLEENASLFLEVDGWQINDGPANKDTCDFVEDGNSGTADVNRTREKEDSDAEGESVGSGGEAISDSDTSDEGGDGKKTGSYSFAADFTAVSSPVEESWAKFDAQFEAVESTAETEDAGWANFASVGAEEGAGVAAGVAGAPVDGVSVDDTVQADESHLPTMGEPAPLSVIAAVADEPLPAFSAPVSAITIAGVAEAADVSPGRAVSGTGRVLPKTPGAPPSPQVDPHAAAPAFSKTVLDGTTDSVDA